MNCIFALGFVWFLGSCVVSCNERIDGVNFVRKFGIIESITERLALVSTVGLA